MLQLALRFHEKGRYESHADPTNRRKPKVAGYQLIKPNYHILKRLAGDQINEIPRSRIVEYHYVTVADTIQQQGNYFILPIEESQLPSIEAITKIERNPSVYLWRDEQWWSFPQLEMYNTGELTTVRTTMGDLFGNVHETREHQVEKTAFRIRSTYEPTKGPGFALTPTISNSLPDAPANLPTTITGNGMVLEWKRGYEDKPPCWWIRDERRVSKAQSATYRHYATLKATPHARWSKGFSAWYYTGGSLPPQKWLELVSYTGTVSPTMSPELSQQIEAVLAAEKELLIPLALYDAHAGRYDWNYGNPEVWCKLYNRTEQWLLLVANASLTERSLYGYHLQLAGDLSSEGQPNQILSGEWVQRSIPELDSDTTRLDPNFIRQSLYQAVRSMAHLAANELPDEVLTRLAIPSDAECRRHVFEERHQAYLAELERKRELAALMKPYHEFQVLLKLRQRFEERLHQLTTLKALPAQSTPPLDDPWS